jgi:hypothetical protein
MKLIDHSEDIWNAFYDNRKISRPSIDKVEFDRFLMNLDAINALPRHTKKYNDIPLEDIVIDSRFKQLVLPESVTLTSSYEDEDFLFRETIDMDKAKMYSEVDFMRIVRILSNAYKIADPQALKLTDIRKDISLSSEAKFTFSSIVHDEWMTSGRIPTNTMPLPLVIKLLDDTEYSMFHDSIVERVIVQMFD